MEQKYLNTAQTAQYFGVTTATIRNWQRQQLFSEIRTLRHSEF